MLNMSFGIQVNEAVANHGLTIGDFAATDLTVELLYLMEAKTAAMEESRKLNLKLENARLAAEESSFTDPLTGLRNRRGFEALMPHHIGRNEPFAIMAMDLDFFKEVNDINGHAAGDAVLQEVANRTVSNFRPLDLVTRIGGDEFLIYVSELDRPDVLHRLARRLITRLCEPILFEGLELKLSASIGIATSDGAPSDTLNAIVKRADKALYAAKSAGRGVSRLAPKIEQEEAL